MNVIIKDKLAKQVRTISVLTLVAFLFAFFNHSIHVIQHSTNIDQPDCHVCQQNIDAPPKAVKQSEIFLFAFDIIIDSWVNEYLVKPYYGKPQLRAPPNFI